MIAPKEKPTCTLLGQDGNAFAILGAASKALRKAGADEEFISKYQDEATVDNYNHLLHITMNYVDVM